MDAERLRSIPLFDGLSRHERQQVAKWADEVDVEQGKHLVDQGEFPHEFFVIELGSADVLIDGEHIDTLGPGDFFGEIALLEHHRRTASVVATSPLRAIVMHSRDFGAMEETIPEVAERVREAMRQRLAGR